MPSGRQDEQGSLADGSLNQSGVSTVKARHCARSRHLVELDAAVFPKVELGKVAVARIRKRSEERMLKINLAQHRVTGGPRFLAAKIVDVGQSRDSLRRRR